jgi:hypothetical protein
MAKEITEKNRQVIDAYLSDPDKIKYTAYIKYHPNCPMNQAVTRFNEIWNKPEVKEYLKTQLTKVSDKALVTPEKIIREWANRAFFNPLLMFNSEYKLFRPQELPKNIQRLLIGIDIYKAYELEEQGGSFEAVLSEITKRFKVAHQQKAMENLTRINGMYQDKVDVTSKGERIKIDIVYTNNTLNITGGEGKQIEQGKQGSGLLISEVPLKALSYDDTPTISTDSDSAVGDSEVEEKSNV